MDQYFKMIKEFIKKIQNILFKSKTNFLEPVEEEKEETLIGEVVEEKKEEHISSSTFDGIKVGDIILARRYQTEEEMQNLPFGHREGPYIVIKKDGDKVLSIKGTGKNPLDKWPTFEPFKYVTFPENSYFLFKTTYFNLLNTKWVEASQFIKKTAHLTVHDLNEVYRKLEQVFTNNSYQFDNFTKEDIPKIAYYHGDVILLGKSLFYIYEINERNATVIPLKRKKEASPIITINNRSYTYDLHNSMIIKCKNIRNLYGIVDWKQVKRIHDEKERLDNREFIISNIERGSVISYQDKKYYIYGMESYQYQAFEIFEDDIELQKIVIEETPFYTNFSSELLISMKETSIVGLYKATEKEKDEISNQRKVYKKTIKNQTKTQAKKQEISYPKIQEKKIIKIKGTLEKYIVLVRKGNDIWCCPYEEPRPSYLTQITVNSNCLVCNETEAISEEQYVSLLGYYSGVEVTDSNTQNDVKQFIRSGMK